jgi:hypothetical protein
MRYKLSFVLEVLVKGIRNIEEKTIDSPIQEYVVFPEGKLNVHGPGLFPEPSDFLVPGRIHLFHIYVAD